MSYAEFLSKIDSSIRGKAVQLPPSTYTSIYSRGRKYFLDQFYKENNYKPVEIPPEYKVKAWGLEFRCGIFNAAGMFKQGSGYKLAYSQGAGAWLFGTTTANPRKGNRKHGITHPFIPLQKSGAAINWMGLPNEGHSAAAKAVSFIEKKKVCPVGASVSADPGVTDDKSLAELLEGMEVYEMAGVDFIEINESCPNVPHNSDKDSSGLDKNLLKRLEYIKDNYLRFRQRNLPVIVKVSNDTEAELIPALLDALLSLGYDGINLGNTSAAYDRHLELIHPKEQKAYNWFTKEFGGGVSGIPLKASSLSSIKIASEHLKKISLNREFHIIRTGGVLDLDDIKQSEEAGVVLNQWFTGYFDKFAIHGHRLYDKLFKGL